MPGAPAGTVLPKMTADQRAGLVTTSSAAAVEMLRNRMGNDQDGARRLRKVRMRMHAS
jgi:hypothetical protein